MTSLSTQEQPPQSKSASLDEELDEEAIVDMTGTDLDFDSFTVDEDELAKDILSKVTDLQKYMAEISAELATTEKEAVPEYFGLSGTYAELYRELGNCDATLGMLENLLSGFQDQLSSINSDIKALQEASVASNTKIANRKAALEQLSRIVGELSIPRDMITELTTLPVSDPKFLKQLSNLNRKLAFLAASLHENKQEEPKAVTEAMPKLIELRDSTSNRLYTHLIRLMSAATSGGTVVSADIGLLRKLQSELLSTQQSYQFLFKHARERADEVCSRYVEVSSSFYDMYVRRYSNALAKFALDTSSRGKNSGDLLGSEEPRPQKLRSLLVFTGLGGNTSDSSSSSTTSSPQSLNMFSLGSRYTLLEQVDSSPITVPSASEGPGNNNLAGKEIAVKVSYEFVWRSVVKVLVELSDPEMLFVQDFFLGQQEIGQRVFRKASQAMVELLYKHLQNSRDLVGVAIMLCVSEHYSAECEKDDALSEFHTKCIELLTSRIEAITSLHYDSLRSASSETLGNPTSCVSPHFVMRRFAELSTSLLTIAGPGKIKPDAPKQWLLRGGKPLEKANASVNNSLKALRREIERLMQRLSQSFADADQRTVFLINNYDLTLRILRERNIEIGCDIVERFKDLSQTAIHSFRDSQIVSIPAFRELATFIGEIKPLLEDKQTLASHPRFTRDSIEGILRDFALNWRAGVEKIRGVVVKSFSNLDTGNSILSVILENLFDNYKQLLNLIKDFFPDLRHSKFFVAETEILYEMRKKSEQQHP